MSKQEFMVFKLSRISRLEILDAVFENRDCDFTALSRAGRIELEKKAANEKRNHNPRNSEHLETENAIELQDRLDEIRTAIEHQQPTV